MELYIFLLIVVSILSFFGGFGCGVEYEYLRNKKELEKIKKNKSEALVLWNRDE